MAMLITAQNVFLLEMQVFGLDQRRDAEEKETAQKDASIQTN